MLRLSAFGYGTPAAVAGIECRTICGRGGDRQAELKHCEPHWPRVIGLFGGARGFCLVDCSDRYVFPPGVGDIHAIPSPHAAWLFRSRGVCIGYDVSELCSTNLIKPAYSAFSGVSPSTRLLPPNFPLSKLIDPHIFPLSILSPKPTTLHSPRWRHTEPRSPSTGRSSPSSASPNTATRSNTGPAPQPTSAPPSATGTFPQTPTVHFPPSHPHLTYTITNSAQTASARREL